MEEGVCNNIRNTICWWLGSRALDVHFGLIEELCNGDGARWAEGALCHFDTAPRSSWLKYGESVVSRFDMWL